MAEIPCPHCGQEISDEESVCPHCNCELEPAVPAPIEAHPPEESPGPEESYKASPMETAGFVMMAGGVFTLPILPFPARFWAMGSMALGLVLFGIGWFTNRPTK